jgi:hypothetical protein
MVDGGGCSFVKLKIQDPEWHPLMPTWKCKCEVEVARITKYI